MSKARTIYGPRKLGSVPAELGETNGNRFLALDLLEANCGPPPEVFAELASVACATPFADDLLVLERGGNGHPVLRVFGADRREADSCGNGLLYAASLLERQFAETNLEFSTRHELHRVERIDGRLRVDIGPCERILQTQRPPISIAGELGGLVRAGEPHAVLIAPKSKPYESREEFDELCLPFRDCFDVEGGVNVTVVYQHQKDKIRIRTFERGVNRGTDSCGTGSVAACAVLELRDHPVQVVSPGGEHIVARSRSGIWSIAANPRRTVRRRLEELISTGEIRSIFERVVCRGHSVSNSRNAG